MNPRARNCSLRDEGRSRLTRLLVRLRVDRLVEREPGA
jgi:hypothetical protein